MVPDQKIPSMPLTTPALQPPAKKCSLLGHWARLWPRKGLESPQDRMPSPSPLPADPLPLPSHSPPGDSLLLPWALAPSGLLGPWTADESCFSFLNHPNYFFYVYKSQIIPT